MRKIVAFFMAVVLSLSLVQPVEAKVITKENGAVTVAADEVVEDDLYVMADIIEILGTVRGDVYAFGRSVSMSGIVTGDFVTGGSDVKITGEVEDDLWIGAGNAYLTGASIGDGVNVGAGNVIIDKETRINGSLLVGAGKLDNDARIGRNLMAGVGTLRLNAPVGGEARIGAGTIELGNETQIEGDLTYASDTDITMSEGASVAGTTNKIDTPQVDQEKMQQDFRQFGRVARTGFNILSFLGALVVGLLLVWQLKKPTKKISDEVENNFLATLGWGLLIVVLSGPAFLLLLLTGIGMPLAFLLGLAVLIVFYLAKIWVSYTIGRLITEQFKWKKMQDGIVFLMGLFVYYVVRIVPVAGGFVRMLVFFSGVGAMWMYLRKLKGLK